MRLASYWRPYDFRRNPTVISSPTELKLALQDAIVLECYELIDASFKSLCGGRRRIDHRLDIQFWSYRALRQEAPNYIRPEPA